MVHPMSNGTYTVSSGYGPRWGTFHAGLDFACSIGTPIYAAADGYVVEGKERPQGSVSGFGSWIWLDCQDSVGKDFIYGHVQHSGILVKAGDRVKAGQQIGVSGNEGESTGPHLHWEVWGSPGRSGGASEDPAKWLLRDAVTPVPAPQPQPQPGKENNVATVLDFSAKFPSGAAIKAAGHRGVVSYISPPREPWMTAKPLRANIVDDYRRNGLDIACVWQYGGGNNPDVMRGREGGLADARAALAKLKEVGLPDHPVFFNVDFDISLAQWNSTAVNYFRAACELLGKQRVGIYGHSRVCDWAREDGVVAEVAPGRALAWQTKSWSGGVQGSNYCVLYQGIHNVDGPEGIKVDVNTVWHDNWGQKPVGAAPAPAPTPAPQLEAPVQFINSDPVDADWSARFGFGGPRSTNGLLGICVHTTENNLGTKAENVANYQINSESGSYHVLVDNTTDDNVRSIRENTDDWVTWSAGPRGNQLALHISFVARAAMSRGEWLSAELMLREGADVAGYWARRFNIPVEKIDSGAMLRGTRGIFGHVDVSRAWGESDHTDPGGNFPWDVFLRYIRESPYYSGTTTPAVPSDLFDALIQEDPMLESLINPAKKFAASHMLRMVDASQWRTERMMEALLIKNGVNPTVVINDAIRKDREGK